MLGWLFGGSRREAELSRQLEAAHSELAGLKAATAGDLLASGGNDGMPFRSSDLAKAPEQLQHFRGYVFACVHALASRIAGQAVRVGSKGKSRPGSQKGRKTWQPAGYVPLESHPLLTLLTDEPNELQVGWSCMYFTVCNLELTGRCLWYAPKQEPPTVLPLPSSWLTGFVGTTRFEAFKIRPPGHTEEITIPADEACYYFYPAPWDCREAASPLQAAAYAVAADEEIQKSQVAAFKNGIFPKHGIIVGERATPDGTAGIVPTLNGNQRRQLINAVLALYRGSCRSGEPIVLDGLVKDIKELSRSNQEMDWQASSETTKARICQIFGVNPIILGQVIDANRASATAAESHLASTINPKLQLIGATLSAWLAPRFGDGLKVWLDPYEAKDAELEIRRYQLAAQFGALEINELRAFCNLPSVDYGDAPVSPPGGIADGVASMIDSQLAAIGSRELFGKANGHALQNLRQ